MPWWGWLIAAALAAFCAMWLVTVTVAVRSARRINQQMDADQDRWRHRHGFGRGPLR